MKLTKNQKLQKLFNKFTKETKKKKFSEKKLYSLTVKINTLIESDVYLQNRYLRQLQNNYKLLSLMNECKYLKQQTKLIKGEL